MNAKQIAHEMIVEERQKLSMWERDLRETKEYWEQAMAPLKRQKSPDLSMAEFMIEMCEKDLREVEAKKAELKEKANQIFQDFAFSGIGDTEIDEQTQKQILEGHA